MATIIDRACDCSIKQFMDCQFSEKYKVLVIDGEFTDEEQKAAFELVYAEYIDLAGLFITREFEIYAYISSLDNRINTIKQFIALQTQFIGQFQIPFVPGLGIISKYGHKLFWVHGETDLDWFIRKMETIRLKEKKYEIQRDGKIADLMALRKKRNNKEHTLLQSRKEFISMLTKLQQSRFVIDKEKTSVEELAIMIKDSRDEVESQNAVSKSKRQ